MPVSVKLLLFGATKQMSMLKLALKSHSGRVGHCVLFLGQPSSLGPD